MNSKQRHKIALPSSSGIRTIPKYVTGQLYLDRSFGTISISIGTTPTNLIRASSLQQCMLFNPSRPFQQSNRSTLTLFESLPSAPVDTTDDPINVGGFEYAHVYIVYLPNMVGRWSLTVLSYCPNETEWIAMGTYRIRYPYFAIYPYRTDHLFLGPLGVTEKLAFRFTGSINTPNLCLSADISVLMKGGGGSSSLAQSDRTIYLGSSSDVTTDSGFPLLPGEKQQLVLGENTELWGVSNLSTPINLLLL